MNTYGMSFAGLIMLMYVIIRIFSGYNVTFIHYNIETYVSIFITAFFSTFLSYTFILEGIKIIGSEKASIISMLGVTLTIVFRSLFLGERLEFIQWIGCSLVFIMLFILKVVNLLFKQR